MEAKKLKALQNKWYKKLKAEGFEDIEDHRTGALKNWSGHYINGKRDRNYAGDLIRETDTYFHSAQCVLHGFPFRCARDKRIWSLHCSGLSTRQIAERIGNIDHCTVFQLIKKIRMVFLDTKDNLSIKMVEIRDGKLDDENLIYATWLRPLYYDNNELNEILKPRFMAAMTKRIAQILKYPGTKVRIACLADDPDVILGYSVIEWRKLWWVYVKKAWREMGIAKKLVPGHINSCAYLTRLGKQLKPQAWDVDPYLKEEVD